MTCCGIINKSGFEDCVVTVIQPELVTQWLKEPVIDSLVIMQCSKTTVFSELLLLLLLSRFLSGLYHLYMSHKYIMIHMFIY